MSFKYEYFSVNTNRTHRPKVYMEMLKENKAAAYYGRKHEISKIDKGNTVFLYHNLVGIIAYGMAIDSYKIKEFNGEKDAEYYIPLEFVWVINPDVEPEKAITISEINNKLNFTPPPFFRRAVYPIDENIANVIKILAKTK